MIPRKMKEYLVLLMSFAVLLRTSAAQSNSSDSGSPLNGTPTTTFTSTLFSSSVETTVVVSMPSSDSSSSTAMLDSSSNGASLSDSVSPSDTGSTVFTDSTPSASLSLTTSADAGMMTSSSLTTTGDTASSSTTPTSSTPFATTPSTTDSPSVSSTPAAPSTPSPLPASSSMTTGSSSTASEPEPSATPSISTPDSSTSSPPTTTPPSLTSSTPIESSSTPSPPTTTPPSLTSSTPIESSSTPSSPTATPPSLTSSTPIESSSTPSSPTATPPSLTSSTPIESSSTPSSPTATPPSLTSSTPIESSSTSSSLTPTSTFTSTSSVSTPATPTVTASPPSSPAAGGAGDNTAISLPLIVGSVASIVVLVFTNIAQLVLCYFSTSRGYDFIHINIVVGLICGLIFLLVGNVEAIWRVALTCKVFSALTTYFLLVPFVWFLAEVVFMNFYIRGIATGKYHIALVLLIFCFCWLLPALVAVVTGVVADDNTINVGPDKLIQECWLSVDGGSVAAFLVPVAVLGLLTVALCFLLAWTLRKQTFKQDTEQQKLRKSVMYGLLCLTALLPLMAVTWVVASLYIGFGNLVLGWIYAVVIIITAIAIFVMYVVVKGVPLILMKLDKNGQLHEEDNVEMAPLSNTLTYKEDNAKQENNTTDNGPQAAGVSTFKPGLGNGASEAAVDGEGANGGGKIVDDDKKKNEGEQEGDKVQGDSTPEFSTFKPARLEASKDAPKNEPIRVEGSGGGGESSTDQATPLQAEIGIATKSVVTGEAPKVIVTEESPKVIVTGEAAKVDVDVSEAKANGIGEPPPAEAGKKEEVQKDTPVVEKGKDKDAPVAETVSDAVPADKVDN